MNDVDESGDSHRLIHDAILHFGAAVTEQRSEQLNGASSSGEVERLQNRQNRWQKHLLFQHHLKTLNLINKKLGYPMSF